MASKPRRETVNPAEVATYYCHQRCAAQAFRLNSPDGSSERMEWIRRSHVRLASWFGIEVGAHRVEGNEFISMLTARPDLVSLWSDEEVARRWLKIAKFKRNGQLLVEEPTELDVQEQLETEGRVEKLRGRLSDISWYMGAAGECLSRRINAVDKTSGTVWEGPYRCSKLEGPADELTCAVCIDLNFGEAVVDGVVETWEFSSIHDRIEVDRVLQASKEGVGDYTKQEIARDVVEVSTCVVDLPIASSTAKLEWRRADAWLKPLTKLGIQDGSLMSEQQRLKMTDGPFAPVDGLFENVTLQTYRELLKWVSDCLLGNGDVELPQQVALPLGTLGVSPDKLLATVRYPPRRLVGLRMSRELRARNAAIGLCT